MENLPKITHENPISKEECLQTISELADGVIALQLSLREAEAELEQSTETTRRLEEAIERVIAKYGDDIPEEIQAALDAAVLATKNLKQKRAEYQNHVNNLRNNYRNLRELYELAVKEVEDDFEEGAGNSDLN